MYEWHNSTYLGAAHGLTGIIHTLLQVDWKLTDHILNLFEQCIEFLLIQKLSSGNLKSSLDSHSDRLVQWCHGAPALALLCMEMYRITKHHKRNAQKYLDEAIASSEVIWERGLLKKGLGVST
jgi:lantibiotic modifying enzyme